MAQFSQGIAPAAPDPSPTVSTTISAALPSDVRVDDPLDDQVPRFLQTVAPTHLWTRPPNVSSTVELPTVEHLGAMTFGSTMPVTISTSIRWTALRTVWHQTLVQPLFQKPLEFQPGFLSEAAQNSVWP